MDSTVIIVAAGSGKRMGMDIYKQFIDICGKPVLVHTLEKFQICTDIDDIIVVTSNDDIEKTKRLISLYNIDKAKKVVAGGSERTDSVYNGLKALSDKTGIVLIHDGVRPFISQELISKSIYETVENGACIVAVKVKDTIKASDNLGFVSGTLDRSNLWNIQTPQTFRYDIIMGAYENGVKNKITATDDASLVELLGIEVKIIEGSYNNIKITTKEDLIFAESICGSLHRR